MATTPRGLTTVGHKLNRRTEAVLAFDISETAFGNKILAVRRGLGVLQLFSYWSEFVPNQIIAIVYPPPYYPFTFNKRPQKISTLRDVTRSNDRSASGLVMGGQLSSIGCCKTYARLQFIRYVCIGKCTKRFNFIA